MFIILLTNISSGRPTNIRLAYQKLGKYTMSIKYNKYNGKISEMDVKVRIKCIHHKCKIIY